jgi:hypothetical protein
MSAADTYPEGMRWRLGQGFLDVEFIGARAGPTYMVSLWGACIAAAQRAGLDAILVHDRMSDPPLTGAAQAEFVRLLPQLPLRGFRIAYVARDASDMPLYESTQILVQELDFNARVFANASEAEIWLRFASREG